MLAARQLVHVINLQRMGFVCAFDVQMRYARYHLDELASRPYAQGIDVLLLVEHNPVYTVGLRDKSYSKEDEEKLRATGAEFHRTNRGGLITFHGPGQLVAYPIINLKHFKLGMRDYVCKLEKTMIDTCGFYGLKATTTKDTGVWIEDRKVGAVGIHGSRFITTHGVSLNCNTDLTWFDHIVPCGLEGKTTTSLSKELQKKVCITQTIPVFLKAFQERFGCELTEMFLVTQDHNLMPTPENLRKAEVV
ncbi:putative lipoyltransferase 2, mitochondrial [Dreissena polymorpha]|uniref:Octanoyl-[acyl-carrier-protein]:protein N-octanoyltransferase LIPT2, mitochondrial n=1 Tax=Dreissena polymorpha TaxID=45954 RepID=A0A9D4G079_DREPO|nr:putative lipoyltransferase 2, mitochondrial [Dreissena polymorpha]XP_052216982.1 putative lipoyltransferase 2, mitochondrial [Dreissena polymorpha]XP_052216983.1 putative lipoyltransferase 2, mitochondrial [Dreissena polymorpha]XP_052216984.1 putative lipoyltransferase 2, mitochondrial [Dreissena polymorpha]XP_052216985.1 putative lipoyltransferase 2, mitochondrial [Dreissena polymorpha]XP_052217107.1 putative lipoyltransferase 2, mitochondrial [Dreissena polymorpha]XP_052217108.1 putative